jgi:OOP family OmpA-OmpF porin
MILDKLGALLLLYPGSIVVVEGHTDSSGKVEINMALSEERATSVKEYIQAKSGLGDDQMTSKGFGSNRPITDNTTRKGREQNRRIDIVVSFESES